MRVAYDASLDERLAAAVARSREPQWTEALAVGSKDFVCAVQAQYRTRSRFVVQQSVTESGQEAWSVREAPEPYGGFRSPESGAKRSDECR